MNEEYEASKEEEMIESLEEEGEIERLKKEVHAKSMECEQLAQENDDLSAILVQVATYISSIELVPCRKSDKIRDLLKKEGYL